MKNDEIIAEGMQLSYQEILLAVGDTLTLTYEFTPEDTTKKEVEFTVEGESISVTEGTITAVKAGDSTLTVKQKEGDKYAACKITVADVIVKESDGANQQISPVLSLKMINNIPIYFMQTGDTTNTDDSQESSINRYIGGKLGVSLFNSIQEACARSKNDDVVLIIGGNYDENVKITKSIVLKGVDYPILRGIEVFNDLKVSIYGLNFTDSEYPSGTEARIYVKNNTEITIKDCLINTSSTKELSGGFAIFIDKQSKYVDVQNNTISNFRYGIYVSPTDGNVKVSNNDLSNMNVGVGLDIRQENSDNNYPTKGEILSNRYNEVVTKTQFLHYGDNYQGDFEFKDNELENAATDEGTSGGNGLTE